MPRAEAGAEATAKIVKKGAGVFSMPYATNAVPVVLQEGSLAFDQPVRTWTNSWVKSFSPPDGTGLFVAGEGALGGTVLSPVGDFALTFADNATRSGNNPSDWVCNRWAKAMPDGNTLALTVQGSDSPGSAWRTAKVRVDESFTISYDYCALHAGTENADYATMVAFQTTGTFACGAGSSNLGINNDTISNCWAIGVNLGGSIVYTASRATANSWNITTVSGGTREELMGAPDVPTHCTLAYDADAKRAVFTVSCASTGNTITRTVDVDLAERLGATTAWVGFTGSATANSKTQHLVRNYRRMVGTPEKPARMRTGGTVRLGTGAALSANLAANEIVGSFALDALEAAGAATLDVSAAGAVSAFKLLPVLNTLNHDIWTLLGRASWTETGLSSSMNENDASGGGIKKDAYPATGSWNLAFDWSPGPAPVPEKIADLYYLYIGPYVQLTQNVPSSGITLYFQNYDGHLGKSVVYVRFYVKGTRHDTRYFSTNTTETAVLDMRKDLHVNMAYDDAAKRITLDLSQDDGATAKQLVFANVNMDNVLGGASRAHLGVYSRVGSLHSRAIMSNLSLTGEAMTAAVTPHKYRPSLAFDRMSGATAITKTGDGDLAFLKDRKSVV